MLISPSCILQRGLPHLQQPLPTSETCKPLPDPRTELSAGCSAPAPSLQHPKVAANLLPEHCCKCFPSLLR